MIIMTGFKQREKEMSEKLIQQTLDAFELDTILEYNDIPDIVVLESLVDAGYLTDDDLLEQLDDEGLLFDDYEEEDDES